MKSGGTVGKEAEWTQHQLLDPPPEIDKHQYCGQENEPKLGALCSVMSRMTRVPKHDHINRN